MGWSWRPGGPKACGWGGKREHRRRGREWLDKFTGFSNNLSPPSIVLCGVLRGKIPGEKGVEIILTNDKGVSFTLLVPWENQTLIGIVNNLQIGRKICVRIVGKKVVEIFTEGEYPPLH